MPVTARAALPLALLLLASCARTRTETFMSPPILPEPPVRDSVSVAVRGLPCGELAVTALFRPREVVGALSQSGPVCGAWISVESVAGDSAVLRFSASAGEMRIEQPIVARRGRPREYELASGVRVTASVREYGPGA